MQSRILRIIGGSILFSLAVAGICMGDTSAPPVPVPVMPPAQPMHAPMPAPSPQPTTTAITKPLDLLVWDSVLKEQSPLPNQPTANFVFNVTNPSDMDVVITDVHTSCGCTVAKLPSKPWVLTPHTNGQLGVSVNLAGKSGTFFKTITVSSTNDMKLLTIKINLPESPAMMRARNQQMAMIDPQAVFKGGCAKCHFDTAKGKTGKELYVVACGICHDAKPRATMVTDLNHIKHPTDYAFWAQTVTFGKPKTLMPAFAMSRGGPLNNEQIDSLAKFLDEKYPSHLTNGIPMTTGINQPGAGTPAMKN